MPDTPLIKGLFQSQMDVVTCVDILSGEKLSEEKLIEKQLIEEKLSRNNEKSKEKESKFNPEISGKKVIVLGGGMTGLVTADYIAAKGNEVYVLNRKKSFAEEMSANDRYYLRENLKKKGVTLYKNVVIESFTARGVKFHIKNNESSFIDKSSFVNQSSFIDECDMVVISEKHISIRDIKKFEPITRAEFHFIGDAKSPRHLMYCVSEAEEIARASAT
ncbi:MAG: FAD-dependent oxidoreductase, partial [Desulfamplus sp.]|nr:FAD-dependent oxidoreductase [Desulfamplus sp.]